MSRLHNGSGWLQTLLALVFSVSFFVYFLDVSETQLAMPVGAFCLIGLVLLIRSLTGRILRAEGKFSVSRPAATAVIALCIPIVVSEFSGHAMAAVYGLALVASVISARVILCYLSLGEILLAFFYSALISAVGFFVAGYEVISGSALGQVRLNLFSFHPNLIGFIFGAYVVVAVYALLLRGSRMAGIFLIVSLTIIFLASSRGSLVAIAAATCVAAALAFVRGLTWKRFTVVSGWGVTVVLGMLAMAIIVWAVLPQVTKPVVAYVDNVLDISNEYRGLDTGLTGRVDNWRTTIAAIDGGRWLVGYGYRTSATDLGFSVDNGYLTLIYETGFVTAAVIFFLYAATVVRLVHSYWKSASKEESTILLVAIAFMAYFLVNNLVARYLLGIGNPVSLLALFFLVHHATDVRHATKTQEEG